MDQPYSRMGDMLLDTQYYNINDPRPYDDTGWTLGPLHNVKTVRVKDLAILDAPMTLTQGKIKVQGKADGGGKAAIVINHTGESAVAQLRFRLPDIKFSVAEAPFKVGDREFNAGSYIVTPDGNPADVAERLKPVVLDLGLSGTAVDKMPDVAKHAVSVPRIAIVHTWLNTQDEGWFRIEFDRLGIPYTYISDQNLGKLANLRDKFDVIVFGPVRTSAQNIVRGNASFSEKEGAIPWKQSAVTPNMGKSPDQTDDIRGGLSIAGVARVDEFVKQGGLFVTVADNASLPIDYGITTGVSVDPAKQLQARGSVLNAIFSDRRSPIAYGYNERLAVYFNQSPILNVGGAGGGFGGGGGGEGAATGANRPSGRGTVDDPDIVQGRPLPDPNAPVEAPNPANIPPAETRARVILRFAPEKELLVSGMLAGGSELAGKPAIVDVPVGRGHVVMFANNPMWRHETHGSFTLLFNAILNYDYLGVGRPPARGNRPDTGEELYEEMNH
ncbi:MAG: hypothetical protein ACJ73D_00700 [Pyrinomonadaceae bacterium]